MTKVTAKQELQMPDEDRLFRDEVLDLLPMEENEEVFDIFDPLFVEATVELSSWLFMHQIDQKHDVKLANFG